MVIFRSLWYYITRIFTYLRFKNQVAKMRTMRICKSTKYANRLQRTVNKTNFSLTISFSKSLKSNCRKYVTNYFQKPFTIERIDNLQCPARISATCVKSLRDIVSTHAFAEFVLSPAIDIPNQWWRISIPLHELLTDCQSAGSPTIASSPTMKLSSHCVRSVPPYDYLPLTLAAEKTIKKTIYMYNIIYTYI